MKIKLIILFLLSFLLVKSQEEQINVLFVLDASSSMYKKWGKNEKWKIAEESLITIADSLTKEHKNLNFGLRVYGSNSLPSENDCLDTELKLPIGKHEVVQLKNKLTGIKPKGITPLAYTLEQTEDDFKNFEHQRNILILITDGSESCESDPCEILQILLKREVIVKPVIIGLNIDVESLKAYDCIHEIYNPQSAIEFQKNVLQVVKNAINFSSLQVNLLDENKQPKQSNLAMFFYSDSKKPDYTFYHQINNGQSDTLFIEPKENYTIKVQTLPPTYYHHLKLQQNQHNIVNIPAPTCNLSINTYNFEDKTLQKSAIPYFIKTTDVDTFFYSASTNTSQKYLIGKYDIDVLTLPITRIKDFSCSEKNKEIKIQAAGQLIIQKDFNAYGSIFVEVNKELINIYDLSPNSKQEILDLQPGKYQLVYRFVHDEKMEQSKQKIFEIKTKEFIKIKL